MTMLMIANGNNITMFVWMFMHVAAVALVSIQKGHRWHSTAIVPLKNDHN